MPRFKKKFRSKFLLLAIVLIAVVLFFLEVTHRIHLFHHEKPKPVAITGGAYTKGAGSVSQQKANQQQSNSNSSSTSKQSGDANSSSNDSLVAPWGTFFNNSPVKLDDPMGSTCNTTPGATCQIIFTNGNLIQSLPVENSDAGGAVYWSWTPREVGLTPGTWHVSAKAVLGTQTKTTSNDPLTLEVT